MRICLIYDCLFPFTVGGAERWYRNLAEQLARDGHQVTYLTLRQWEDDADIGLPGVDVRAVGPKMALYGASGGRRILPPLRFGLGVLWHLLRRGRVYDAVHTASFPYFSLLAAGFLRRPCQYQLIVDWHEVWSADYWREYLGAVMGTVGWLIQAACMRFNQRAFCFSQLHAGRLGPLIGRERVTVLRGEYAGPRDPERVLDPEPVVVFAGRLIPEKQVSALVPAIAHARREIPELTCDVYGDGPDREVLSSAIAAWGLDDVVRVHGFVDGDVLDHALSHAMCLVVPSRREGYGLVVVEASARGTPSIVVAGDDNAAVELISEGQNGLVSLSQGPTELSAAIRQIWTAGADMRVSARAWYLEHEGELALASSLESVVSSYRPRSNVRV